jgi:hypothetical protein
VKEARRKYNEQGEERKVAAENRAPTRQLGRNHVFKHRSTVNMVCYCSKQSGFDPPIPIESNNWPGAMRGLGGSYCGTAI